MVYHSGVEISPETLSLGGPQERLRRDTVRMLFIALEGSRPLSGSTRLALVDVDEVLVGRGEKRSWKRTRVDGRHVLKLTIPDSWMSKRHARIVLDAQPVRVEDLGSKNGTLVNGQAIGDSPLASDDVIEIGCTFLSFIVVPDCDVCDAVTLESAVSQQERGMATILPSLRRQVGQLKKIARSKASVIVHGESGTGKELMAQAIHTTSERTGPFVAVNCAAISESLLESELFGHRRGAFSGALNDRKGLVETSSGGTLFLDEIGELSAKGQASLLRVLQQQEVMPVGANQPIAIDLRVVAATHRDLLADVASGVFREDLYGRLSTFVMTVPPLRERVPEFGSIMASLLAQSPTSVERLCFAPPAARAILQYGWPRNIRELEKCLSSAAVLADDRIELEHLSHQVRTAPAAPVIKDDDAKLHAELVTLLREHSGNVTQVGNALGKKRQQIQKWCKRLKIDPKQFR